MESNDIFQDDLDYNIPIDEDLFTQSMRELAGRFEQLAEEEEESPSDWIENNFLIPTPRDPITGEELPAGPIRLAEHQKRIINEALSKVDGKFKYSTIIYSAPKKSGKSAIASAVALYMAAKTAYGQIYCLANDGKNSKDRLYLPIWRCLNFHHRRGLKLQNARINQTEAFLPNWSHIEAIPCDASGEAGSEPTGVFYSEFWGYIEESKRRLFVEMTLPPTLYGKAIRWIESYAGYMGVSDLLWDMYSLGRDGEAHPDFADLVGREGEAVVWRNERAHVFMYWDTKARMIWQNDDYYRQEAQILIPAEFQRIHHNKWVSPVDVFIRPEWWEACRDETLPDLQPGSDVPVVMAIDAAVDGDCAALVLVTRHPYAPETDIAVRYVRIFEPSSDKPVQIEKDIGGEIRRLCKLYNIVCIAYDAYQMEGLVQNYRKGNVTVSDEEIEGMTPNQIVEYIRNESDVVQRWYYKFGQQNPRAVADKRLFDMVQARQVHWNPNDRNSDIVSSDNRETLTKQIKAAGAKKDGNKLRIEKLSNKAHVDSAVALSMAVQKCMTLLIDNREAMTEDAILAFQRGQITYTQLMEKLKLTREAD